LSLFVATRVGLAPDPWGRPLAPDFTSFWTAAQLALQGPLEAAWNPVAHAAAQRAHFGADAGYLPDYYGFFYPPPFLLICLPLSVLPYGIAVSVWLATTNCAYLAAMRAMLRPEWPIITALAFPAVFWNAVHGQNAALSAALVGAATLQLERRPRVAGLCLGALCFKPQLALLIVPTLVAARRWRSLAWCAISAGVFCSATLMILGEASWRGFLAIAPVAHAAMEAGSMGFEKMVSPFAAMRLLGFSPVLALAGQTACSVAVLAVVIVIGRQRPGAPAETGIMVIATCLATPFLLDYDLMLLAIPLAWIATEARRTSFLPWEKITLASAFVLPLLVRLVAKHTGLPIAPVVMITLLWIALRRVRWMAHRAL
jgi:hypothetical protein